MSAARSLQARLARLEVFAAIEARDGLVTTKTLHAAVGGRRVTLSSWLLYLYVRDKLVRGRGGEGYVLSELGRAELEQLRAGPRRRTAAQHAAYMRGYRSNLRAQGRCAECTRPSGERYRCGSCLAREAARVRRSNQEAAA